MTVCGSCRHVNAEDAKFCLECAARELAEAEGARRWPDRCRRALSSGA